MKVDPTVLEELPADIRKQIEQALAKMKSETSSTVTKESSSVVESRSPEAGVNDIYPEQPGCSHWKGQGKVKADEPVTALPNLSQVTNY